MTPIARPPLIMAIDQGTTSTRAIVFDTNGSPLITHQQEIRQIFPADGWVEHDPQDIWSGTVAVCKAALADAESSGEVVSIGITNQRETTLVWDRETHEVVHNAIVWQDRRTAEHCARLRERGEEPGLTAKTGLLLDPYFSATKLAWILDNVPGVRERATAGKLAFGTPDCFLLWRLTAGRVHATDATNASRTSLFDIHAGSWDPELLELFDIPASLLPDVRDSSDHYGHCDPELLGRSIAIGGIAGDQQAAAIGQACIRPGMIKSTYGTGCFVLLNTGREAVRSDHRLLTTLAYRLAGKSCYALEGSIFIAGAAVQWLRDGLHVLRTAAETEGLASRLGSNHGVYLVPAFTGLGAPYWDADARGALFGLTRDTGVAELARAALESVCYQTHDLFRAMQKDGVSPAVLRVDGGMAGNDWLMQFLADVLAVPVERPTVTETTALGAACLAGLQAGLFSSLDQIASRWRCERRFEPRLEEAKRARYLAGWQNAVGRTRTSRIERT